MKIGVVGYGSIGSRHAANLRTLDHDVVVFDPVGRMDVKFERMVYDICDAVVIATPSPYHEGPLRACIERGKHAFVEKPISTSIGALPELLRVAGDKKLVVMMGNNLRFHGCVRQAKTWLDAGEIGKPIWANFICSQGSQYGKYIRDGVILNSGAHEVDVALHLFGPARVVMASVHGSVGGDTIADFLLVHDNGVRSTFHLDSETPNEIREFWIAGQDKNIGVDLVGRRISLGEQVSSTPGSYDEDYLNEMRCFIQRIEGDHDAAWSEASGIDGLATLQTLLYVRKKAGLK